MMILTIFLMLGGICFYLIGLLIEKDKELEEAVATINELRHDSKYFYREGFSDAIVQQEILREKYESQENEAN